METEAKCVDWGKVRSKEQAKREGGGNEIDESCAFQAQLVLFVFAPLLFRVFFLRFACCEHQKREKKKKGCEKRKKNGAAQTFLCFSGIYALRWSSFLFPFCFCWFEEKSKEDVVVVALWFCFPASEKNVEIGKTKQCLGKEEERRRWYRAVPKTKVCFVLRGKAKKTGTTEGK